jgi:hypothetical protein
MKNAAPRRVFVLRIAAPPGAAGLHALRAVLKRLLRQHGCRALDVRQYHDAAAGDVNAITESKSPAAMAQQY